jgi:arsenite/tail-anchored protein-transporting ATPase
LEIVKEIKVRIIFIAGKGGVGKTSVSAATGIRAAEMGYKTVIISLDVAHSLSDIFDLDKGLFDHNKGKPVNVAKNLWIQELDINEEIEGNWGEIHKYISALLNTTGLDEILAEELSILPGMEEVSLLLYINQYVQQKTYDVIILDCAPTGESIRFINIPTTLEWYINKIFKMERTLARYVGPVAKRIYDVPIPGDDYFEAIARLFERLKGVDKVLVDPKTTTVRLVTNPEKVVLKETQRAFMYFCLNKMNVDAIIINRIIPTMVRDKFFNAWKDSQKVHMENAEKYFDPIPVFKVSLFKGEVIGHSQLKKLSETIYNGVNPLDRFYVGEPYSLIKEGNEYRLILKLPFIERDDVDLNMISDELIIRIGTYKRNIMLPRQVAAFNNIKAKYVGQNLNIYFKGDNHGKRKTS